jgi:hypothetical protein
VRTLLTYTSYALGALMILTGLFSLFTIHPRPELATTGVTLLLATGLVGTVKNGNGKK